MPQKEITVCQGETLHPETCLVAIEPVSNFILLEKYADSRKASVRLNPECIARLSDHLARLTGNQTGHISVGRGCFYRFRGTCPGDSAVFVNDHCI